MPDHDPIPRWTDAALFAAELHGNDLRKHTRIPYLTRVMAVAEVLAYRYPERDELILAGLLHDVVEDTDARFETLEARFGARVAALVRAVSDERTACRAERATEERRSADTQRSVSRASRGRAAAKRETVGQELAKR